MAILDPAAIDKASLEAGLSISIKLEGTAFLLRERCVNPIDALRESATMDVNAQWFKHDGERFVATQRSSVDASSISVLWRSSERELQPWQRLLTHVLQLPDMSFAMRESHGVVVFVPCGHQSTRIAAWTFGTASHWVRPDSVDPRFGLLAALNAIAESATSSDGVNVGAMSGTVVPRDGNAARVRVEAIRPTSVGSMSRVNTDADALTSVSGRTTGPFSRVTGARALRTIIDISHIDDLVQSSTQILDFAGREDYKDEHGWIDRIQPELDQELVRQALDCVLTDQVSAVDIFWWTDPREHDSDAPIAWWSFEGRHSVRGRHGRNEVVRNVALTWDGVRKSLETKWPGQPGSELLRKHLRFFDEADHEIGRCEIRDLLSAELTIDGANFHLSDGDLYRVDKSFVGAVDDDLRSHLVDPGFLPPYDRGGDEQSYNTEAAARFGHVLLDRTQLRLPGQSPFEPGDLLTSNGQLIHVKVKSKSGPLSHLCQQAVVSAKLLRREATARDELVRLVKGSKADQATKDSACSKVAGIASPRPAVCLVLAIIGSWRGEPEVAKLPLLSRIALRGCFQSLADLGFEAHLALVGA